MKTSTTFASLVAYCAIGVLAMPSNREAVSELTSRNENSLLEKRKCYNGKKEYGCDSKGWCWKKCGGGTPDIANSGPWCWAKWNYGWGDGNWVSCHSDSDCKKAFAGEAACAQGNCEGCGCSC
ncbi:IDI-2 precursor [Fusarium mexicanum]|uniref:IDI-2 n=1 Tax=Fusarium mexicanum TaxID=751941 RepID=A0A8H5JDE8_9HYPO|nr:IDI-2 precursor [Fusarium mexicanum]